MKNYQIKARKCPKCWSTGGGFPKWFLQILSLFYHLQTWNHLSTRKFETNSSTLPSIVIIPFYTFLLFYLNRGLERMFKRTHRYGIYFIDNFCCEYDNEYSQLIPLFHLEQRTSAAAIVLQGVKHVVINKCIVPSLIHIIWMDITRVTCANVRVQWIPSIFPTHTRFIVISFSVIKRKLYYLNFKSRHLFFFFFFFCCSQPAFFVFHSVLSSYCNLCKMWHYFSFSTVSRRFTIQCLFRLPHFIIQLYFHLLRHHQIYWWANILVSILDWYII